MTPNNTRSNSQKAIYNLARSDISLLFYWYACTHACMCTPTHTKLCQPQWPLRLKHGSFSL